MGRLKQIYLLWNGRASRKTYWIFSIPIVVLFLLVEFVFINLNEYIYYAVLLIVFYTSMMINIKRAHDRNRTGFFSLLLFVPLVTLWPLVEFGFLPGTDGSNKYGEPDIW
jgi:uncharacterized membrane protein YhaH (DUF805 family)